MKLRMKVVAALMAGVVILGGCGAKDSSSESTTTSNNKTEITAEMAEKYVTLGNYDGLELVKYVRQVSDEDIEYQKEMFMEDYRVQSEIEDRGIESGDFVSLEMKEQPEGSEEVDYGIIDIQVGQVEFNEEVDQALLGHKTGETVTAESVYEEEGQEIKSTYTMVISSVYSVSYPEYTEEFVKENTDYASIAELEESFKTAVAEENEEVSLEELRDSAFLEVVNASEFKDIPQELYDSSYEEMKELYASYAEMFGMELTDMISEEELQEEAKLNVHQELVIQSLIKKENIQKDDKEYEAYVKKCMEAMEVETEEELDDYYEEGELEGLFFREKALDAIIAKAKVTEEAAAEEEFEEEETEETAEEETIGEGETLKTEDMEQMEQMEQNIVVETEE